MNHTGHPETILPDWKEARIQELERQLAEAKALSSENRTTDGGRSSPAGALAQGTPDNVQGAAPGLPGSHDKREKLTARQIESIKYALVENIAVDPWMLDAVCDMALEALKSATAQSKIVDHAEVIGNVTAALLDLDATYDGNRVTFTFLSTNDAMSYIQRARRIVEERLALIRAAQDSHPYVGEKGKP